MKKGLVLIAMFLLLQESALAASFDCEKAQSFAEKAICSDSSLTKLDSYLNMLYENLMQLTNKIAAKKSLAQSQNNWLQTRSKCADSNCIKQLYQSRINQLLNLESQVTSQKTAAIKTIIPQLNGSWLRQNSNQSSQSDLTINNANSNGFDFKFTTNNGANTGALENKAIFTEKEAFFVDDAKLDQSYKIPCTVRFQFFPSAISVTTNSACSYYGGVGVSFAGNYSKNTKQTKQNVSDMVALGLLSNTKQEEDFKNLTGKDYPLFLNNCGNILSEANESVVPKAAYKEAFMSGLANQMACIVMSNDNYIWAAVIDSNQNTIKYFSNDPNFINNLPKAIKDWADRINQNRNSDILKLIFMNAK